MAGHSHWAGIKHKKAVIDAKRGKLWSKLSKAIIVAAKHGGGDVDKNLKLRYAVDDARKLSMPRDNIERAIKRGTGELAGDVLHEVCYEGYGPEGTAVIAEGLTDKTTRTSPEVKKIFEKGGGSMGTSGCVSWMFETKGFFVLEQSAISEDELMDLALEAGAEDVREAGETWEVLCEPDAFDGVKAALDAKELEQSVSEVSRIASNTVEVTEMENVEKVLKLLELLDDHDDIQKVYCNFSIPDEIAEQLSS